MPQLLYKTMENLVYDLHNPKPCILVIIIPALEIANMGIIFNIKYTKYLIYVQTQPLFLEWVLLYLRSPKGGCLSISDDLSCSCILGNKVTQKKIKGETRNPGHRFKCKKYFYSVVYTILNRI